MRLYQLPNRRLKNPFSVHQNYELRVLNIYQVKSSHLHWPKTQKSPRKSLAAGWTNTPPSIANSRPLTTKCPDIREPLTTKCPDTNYHTISHRDHPFISSFFSHFITLMNGVFLFWVFFQISIYIIQM